MSKKKDKKKKKKDEEFAGYAYCPYCKKHLTDGTCKHTLVVVDGSPDSVDESLDDLFSDIEEPLFNFYLKRFLLFGRKASLFPLDEYTWRHSYEEVIEEWEESLKKGYSVSADSVCLNRETASAFLSYLSSKFETSSSELSSWDDSSFYWFFEKNVNADWEKEKQFFYSLAQVEPTKQTKNGK